MPRDAPPFCGHEVAIMFTKSGKEGRWKESGALMALERQPKPWLPACLQASYVRKINLQFKSSPNPKMIISIT